MIFHEARLFEGTGFLEPMETSAQNFEDVTLRRCFPDIIQGFYVDVGAFHPKSHSVTKYFYDKGWSGINIEPNFRMIGKFQQERLRDINLAIAIGGSDGYVDLHVVGDTGLTSIVEDVAKSHEGGGHIVTDTFSVQMTALQSLFDEYCVGTTIDFLKVDVEGAESIVLNSCEFKTHRPRVILAENSDGYHEWLLKNEYIFCWFDGLNRWYVRNEDEWRCDLIARPPSVWDNIANIQRDWD